MKAAEGFAAPSQIEATFGEDPVALIGVVFDFHSVGSKDGLLSSDK
jgi:hypothetical protein